MTGEKQPTVRGLEAHEEVGVIPHKHDWKKVGEEKLVPNPSWPFKLRRYITERCCGRGQLRMVYETTEQCTVCETTRKTREFLTEWGFCEVCGALHEQCKTDGRPSNDF